MTAGLRTFEAMRMSCARGLSSVAIGEYTEEDALGITKRKLVRESWHLHASQGADGKGPVNNDDKQPRLNMYRGVSCSIEVVKYRPDVSEAQVITNRSRSVGLHFNFPSQQGETLVGWQARSRFDGPIILGNVRTFTWVLDYGLRIHYLEVPVDIASVPVDGGTSVSLDTTIGAS